MIFAVDERTLDAMCDEFDADDPQAELFPVVLRRAAFARYAALAKTSPLPADMHPVWASGTRRLRRETAAPAPTVQSPDPASAELATIALANAGGLVHFGAIAVDAGARFDGGLVVCPLTQAPARFAELIREVIARRCERATQRDALLMTAFANCGAFVYVPDGERIAAPIQLLWTYSQARAHAVFPLIVVVLGRGAQAVVYERHVGEGDAFVGGLVDVQLARDAALDYVVIQQSNESSRVSLDRRARVAQGASLSWSIADLGGARVRGSTAARLDGAHARATLSSLSLRDGRRRVETVVNIDHRAESTRSEAVHCVALTGRGVARHREQIRVHARSNRASASLRADALMLSRDAAVELKPERRAEHDRISIGQRASVGSVEEEALFYLATRGLDRVAATKIAALGFFEPALTRFPGETLRDEIRTALDERIDEAVG